MQNNNYHISKSHNTPLHRYLDKFEYIDLKEINFNTVAHISVSGRLNRKQKSIDEIRMQTQREEDKEMGRSYRRMNENNEVNAEKEIDYQELDKVFLKLTSSVASLNKSRIADSIIQPLNYNLLPKLKDAIGPLNNINDEKDNEAESHNHQGQIAKNQSSNIEHQQTKATLNNNVNKSGDNYSNTIRIPKEIFNLANMNININAFDSNALGKNIINNQIEINISNNINNPTQSSSKWERNPNRESRKCLKKIKKLLIKINSKYQTINEKKSKKYLFAFDNNFYSIIFNKNHKQIASFTKNKLYAEEIIIKEENEISKELLSLMNSIRDKYCIIKQNKDSVKA